MSELLQRTIPENAMNADFLRVPPTGRVRRVCNVVWAMAGFLSVGLIVGDKLSERLVTLLGSAFVVGVALRGMLKAPVRQRRRGLRISLTVAAVLGVATLASRGVAGVQAYLTSWSWLGTICVSWLLWQLLEVQRQESSELGVRPVRIATASLAAYVAWLGLASACSPAVETAWKLYGRELCLYTGLFSIIASSTERQRELTQPFLRGAAAAAALTVAGMLLVAGAFELGLLPGPLVQKLSWIRLNPVDPSSPWHLQFPFSHHNRAGYFAMCASFLLPCAALGIWRVPVGWAFGLGILALTAAVFTLTRGAVLGIAVGGTVAGIVLTRRLRPGHLIAGTLVVGICAALVVSSPRRVAHWTHWLAFDQPVKPGTSSVASRVIIQSTAMALFEERPFLGWGYGYEVFEKIVQKKYPGVAASVEGASHPHNHWIEQGFGGGVPALVFFLSFTVARLLALGRSAWQHRGRWSLMATTLALWLGLEFAIQFYGLTNTALRRNLGAWTYALWGVSFVLIRSARRIAESQPGVIASLPPGSNR